MPPPGAHQASRERKISECQSMLVSWVAQFRGRVHAIIDLLFAARPPWPILNNHKTNNRLVFTVCHACPQATKDKRKHDAENGTQTFQITEPATHQTSTKQDQTHIPTSTPNMKVKSSSVVISRFGHLVIGSPTSAGRLVIGRLVIGHLVIQSWETTGTMN